MSAVADAVVSVDCPVTERVPLETSDEVAVIVPPVRELIVPERAESVFVKKVVEVALVVVKLEMTPVTAESSDEK